MTNKARVAEKISFREYSFALKRKVVQQVENGLISKNFAAKKYLASRSIIDYWCKKIGSDMNEENNHSTKKVLKKLRNQVAELKLLTDIRMDIIHALIKELGEDGPKKVVSQTVDRRSKKDGQKLKVKLQAQLFGISRQALHKRKRSVKKESTDNKVIRRITSIKLSTPKPNNVNLRNPVMLRPILRRHYKKL